MTCFLGAVQASNSSLIMLYAYYGANTAHLLYLFLEGVLTAIEGVQLDLIVLQQVAPDADATLPNKPVQEACFTSWSS